MPRACPEEGFTESNERPSRGAERLTVRARPWCDDASAPGRRKAVLEGASQLILQLGVGRQGRAFSFGWEGATGAKSIYTTARMFVTSSYPRAPRVQRSPTIRRPYGTHCSRSPEGLCGSQAAATPFACV